jgi:hypothetical protein
METMEFSIGERVGQFVMACAAIIGWLYFIDNTAHVAAVRDPAEAAYVTSARIQSWSGEVIVIGPVGNRPTLGALP